MSANLFIAILYILLVPGHGLALFPYIIIVMKVHCIAGNIRGVLNFVDLESPDAHSQKYNWEWFSACVHTITSMATN